MKRAQVLLLILLAVGTSLSFADTIIGQCGFTQTAGRYSASVCNVSDRTGFDTVSEVVMNGPQGTEMFSLGFEIEFQGIPDRNIFGDLNPFGQFIMWTDGGTSDPATFFTVYGRPPDGFAQSGWSLGGFCSPAPGCVYPGTTTQAGSGGLGIPDLPGFDAWYLIPYSLGIDNHGNISADVLYCTPDLLVYCRQSITTDYTWSLGKPQPVPEPGSALMLTNFTAALFALLRRRMRLAR